jgi:antibiotic biosynthesis monooxygenase (ABM) superfamily enzyme
MSNETTPKTPNAAPPRYKLALLTWAGAYAVITLILGLLGPTMASWPLPVRTLLISVLMVVALTWVVVPTLVRLFRGWLLHAGARRFAMPTGDRAARGS